MKSVSIRAAKNGYLITSYEESNNGAIADQEVHVVSGFDNHLALGQAVASALGIESESSTKRVRAKRQSEGVSPGSLSQDEMPL